MGKTTRSLPSATHSSVLSTMAEEGREVHYELYRRSTLGMTLTDALDEMVTKGELTPSIAMKVLAQFDKVRAFPSLLHTFFLHQPRAGALVQLTSDMKPGLPTLSHAVHERSFEGGEHENNVQGAFSGESTHESNPSAQVLRAKRCICTASLNFSLHDLRLKNRTSLFLHAGQSGHL